MKRYEFLKNFHVYWEKNRDAWRASSARLNNPKVSQRSSRDFGRVDKLISDRVYAIVSRTRCRLFSRPAEPKSDFSIEWKADYTASVRADEKRKGENPFKAMRLSLKPQRRYTVKRIISQKNS